MADAVAEARVVVSSDTAIEDLSLKYTIAKNVLALFPTHGENIFPLAVVAVLIVIVSAAFFIIRRPEIKGITAFVPAFVTMLHPLAWYMFWRVHAVGHATIYGFHLLIMPIFGLLTIYFYYYCKDR